MLRSLDISGCRKIKTAGIVSIAKGCRRLEVLSIEGCPGITEESLIHLAECCTRIQYLNVTGCSKISEKGIITLAQHLPYLMLASKYCGLEPRPDMVTMKLNVHKKNIAASAAIRIQCVFQGYQGRKRAFIWHTLFVKIPASACIQRAYRAYKFKRHLYERVVKRRDFHKHASTIQALMKGFLVRNRIMLKKKYQLEVSVKNNACMKIQASYRGFYVRRKYSFVVNAVGRVRNNALIKKSAILLQRTFHKGFDRTQVEVVTKLAIARQQKYNLAAILLQRAFRPRPNYTMKGAGKLVLIQSRRKNNKLWHHTIRIQSNWRGDCARKLWYPTEKGIEKATKSKCGP